MYLLLHTVIYQIFLEEQRVRLDLEYLSHWSPWLDVQIVFKTLWVIARDQNAY